MSVQTRFSPEAELFSKILNPDSDPKPLEHLSVPKYAVDFDALEAVEAQIHLRGGEMATGWKVITWPNVLKRADRCICWKKPEGGIVELCACENPTDCNRGEEEEEFFVSDSERLPLETIRIGEGPRFYPLDYSPAVLEYIQLERDAYTATGCDTIPMDDTRPLQMALTRLVAVKLLLTTRHGTPRWLG